MKMNSSNVDDLLHTHAQIKNLPCKKGFFDERLLAIYKLKDAILSH